MALRTHMALHITSVHGTLCDRNIAVRSTRSGFGSCNAQGHDAQWRHLCVRCQELDGARHLGTGLPYTVFGGPLYRILHTICSASEDRAGNQGL